MVVLFVLLLSSKKAWLSSHEQQSRYDSGVTIAIGTHNDAYFLYRGQPAGYQYDILKSYANSEGIPTRFTIASSFSDRVDLLSQKAVDIITIGSDEEYSELCKNPDFLTSIKIDNSTHFALAVRADNVSLLNSINYFLASFTKTSEYRLIFWKYFEAKTKPSDIAKHKKNLSPYDELIKKYSTEIGWDWRLLASLIYQESRFNPEISSHKGAQGLMQLMPATAERFGVADISNPEDNIRAGVAYIKYLKRHILKIDEFSDEECIKFILASYNAGFGRIMEDCRAYTKTLGKDPNIWDNVASTIPLLGKPEHYRDNQDISFGRFRGNETIRFVNQIIERYHHYQNLIPDI